MRMLRLPLVGTVMLALLGGSGGADASQTEESEAMAFPTGTFEATEDTYYSVELNADGTCRWFAQEALSAR